MKSTFPVFHSLPECNAHDNKMSGSGSCESCVTNEQIMIKEINLSFLSLNIEPYFKGLFLTNVNLQKRLNFELNLKKIKDYPDRRCNTQSQEDNRCRHCDKIFLKIGNLTRLLKNTGKYLTARLVFFGQEVENLAYSDVRLLTLLRTYKVSGRYKWK